LSKEVKDNSSIMKIFVLVVTYNALNWIDKCFSSLINSSILLNIIVVDNNSTDNSATIIKQKYPVVNVILSSKNLGFGKANNIGIKKAYDEGADYVFLLNQDAWVEQNTIELLLNVAMKYPEYGILSPVHLSGAGDALDFGFNLYFKKNYPDEMPFVLLKGNQKNELKLLPIDFVNAAFWLISRKLIEDVGGFNPFFYHYGEDMDYINRCFFRKYKVGIVSGAFGFHDRVQTENEYKIKTRALRLIAIDLMNPGNKFNKQLKTVLREIYISIAVGFFSLKLYESINKIRLLFQVVVTLPSIYKFRMHSINNPRSFL